MKPYLKRPRRFAVDELWRCPCPGHGTFPRRALSRSSIQQHARAAPKLPSVRLGQETDRLIWRRLFHTQTVDVGEHAVESRPEALDEIYIKLCTAASKGELEEVDALVHLLIDQYGEHANGRMYAARILSNVNAELGSAEKAAALFEEVKKKGIRVDSSIYHHLLKVLSVHPDHLLRAHVLQEMRRDWVDLSPDGSHDVVAGLIRDGQLEMALGELERMERQNMKIDDWLYHLIIYTLLDREELDEALRLVKGRYRSDDQTWSTNLWCRLLDVASRSMHYLGISYVWKDRVEKDQLVPSDGVCLNVLNTAARHGDADLSTGVFRILAHRGVPVELHHYEALSETYLAREDFRTAMTVHCIAEAAGVTPDLYSMRAMTDWLGDDKTRLQHGQMILKELRTQGRAIPRAAFNCIIQAGLDQDFNRSMELYESMREFCPAGPNIDTFNLVISGCRRSSRFQQACAYHDEMLGLGILPDQTTYMHLIHLITRFGLLQDALGLFDDMTARHITPTRDIYRDLIGRCAVDGHVRLRSLVDDMDAQRFLRS